MSVRHTTRMRPLVLACELSGRAAASLSSQAVRCLYPQLITTRPFSAEPRRQVEARNLKKKEPTNPPNQSYDEAIAQGAAKQQRTPWHREGADQPPVRRERSASAMTKGKLLTTPSRLLKLVIPLSTTDHNDDRKNIEPLALIVHPQQPLSYLERLIQSELPPITDSKGNEKIPSVFFKAESSSVDERGKPASKTEDEDADERKSAECDTSGSLSESQRAARLRGGPGEGGVESYSGAGREADREPSGEFVRWSASTEIGDFIRDAARGAEFAVIIQGPEDEREIRVGVPSFRDRTHYLRQRLRNASRRISQMAGVKKECDAQAHRAAQRVALTGFGLMVGWWIGVYYLTFRTDLGWDTMEPVTYLVGLSGLMGGYLWFLYHNREVSYRAAMNLTISRRQSQLYQAKGFDAERWDELVREGNALRAEIKAIASEYDVEWDERNDEQDERVREALQEDRDRKKKESKEDEDDNDGRDKKENSKKGKE